MELWIWKVFEENLKQVAAMAVEVDGVKVGGGGEGRRRGREESG